MIPTPIIATSKVMPGISRLSSHGFVAQPECQHVGHRELTGVAQRLGHQQQHCQVGHQPADRVQEAVIAKERDQARDAEEGSSRHVVAGHSPAVLEAGDLTTGSVEIGGCLRAARGPVGNAKRDRDEDDEHQERRTHSLPPLSVVTICAAISSQVLARRT